MLILQEQLASLGDVYVNDAFGTAHRAHASTTIIAQFFPNKKCFGYLLAKEIESLNRVLNNSTKPVTAISWWLKSIFKNYSNRKYFR
jgi:phosphoglycerate kinase